MPFASPKALSQDIPLGYTVEKLRFSSTIKITCGAADDVGVVVGVGLGVGDPPDELATGGDVFPPPPAARITHKKIHTSPVFTNSPLGTKAGRVSPGCKSRARSRP